MKLVQIGDCRLIHGDVLESLATLPAGSVHCCVTSPPYWGLRDYQTAVWEGGDAACGHQDDAAIAERRRQKKSMIAVGERIDGSTRTRNHDEEIGQTVQFRGECRKCGAKRIDRQIGLEPTPEAFIAKMVAVFGEVRRVLRDDGTLWLNLGTSYFRDLAKGGSGPNGKHDFIPDYGNARKSMAASGGNRPSQPRGDAPACGSDDTELLGSRDADRACPYCGGELRDGFCDRRGYIASIYQQPSQSQPQPLQKGRDTERLDCAEASPLASSPGGPSSKTLSSSPHEQGVCDQVATVSASPEEPPTSSSEPPASARMSACTGDTAKKERPSEDRTLGKALFCVACGYCTIAPPIYKPKDLLPIPWLVAQALQQDGWYLRSIIVWAKKSPMPESVTDRPTSSWEPIFLMAKSERYFYDAEAVREQNVGTPPWGDKHNFKMNDDAAQGKHGATSFMAGGTRAEFIERYYTNGRNHRNVWTLGPEPFTMSALDFSTADYVDDRGMPRKWSPNCPVHERDGRLRRESPGAVSDDVQASGDPIDSGRNDSRPEPSLPPVAAATTGYTESSASDTPSGGIEGNTLSSKTRDGLRTERDRKRARSRGTQSQFALGTMDSSAHADSQTASERSSEIRKTDHAPEISQHGIDAAESRSHTGRIEPSERFDVPGQHMSESSNAMGGSVLSGKKPSHTLGISFSSKHSKCLCRESKTDHFAVFPTEIPRRAIKAGTSEKGCCPTCGAPWRRVVERTREHGLADTTFPKSDGVDSTRRLHARLKAARDAGEPHDNALGGTRTVGWERTCDHDGEPVPCTVLDPFLGSGTSVAVAVELGRVGVGVELNGEYLKLACKRIEEAYEPKANPLFGEVAPKAVQLEMPR